jgi:hypothetical protein
MRYLSSSQEATSQGRYEIRKSGHVYYKSVLYSSVNVTLILVADSGSLVTTSLLQPTRPTCRRATFSAVLTRLTPFSKVRRNALLTVTSALPVSLIVCQTASYLLTLASQLTHSVYHGQHHSFKAAYSLRTRLLSSRHLSWKVPVDVPVPGSPVAAKEHDKYLSS